MENLKEEYQAKKDKIYQELFNSLIGVGFHPNIRGRINESEVIIGVKKEGEENMHIFMFASDIKIYPPVYVPLFGRNQKPQINYATTGSFDLGTTASVWRTLHAATVLQNWYKVMEICTKACNAIKELREWHEESRKNGSAKIA